MRKLFIIMLLSCWANLVSAMPNSPNTVTHLGGVPKVAVSDVKDVDISGINPTLRDVTYVSNEALCIYTSSQAHNYEITIEGKNPEHYQLTNGARALPVELWWSTNTNPANGQQLSPNKPLMVQNSTGNANPNCPNGLNANLQLRILTNQLNGMTSGTYSGLFEVIVTPLS